MRVQNFTGLMFENICFQSVCTTVNVQTDGDPNRVVCKENVNTIYSALLLAMKDYTLDSRGDIGAW